MGSAILAAILALAVTGAWEMRVRAMGYRPGINDTSDLWASKRSKIGDSPEQTLIIGASRVQFDFDLAAYTRHFEIDVPIQLAMPGSNPMEILEDVATNTSFGGRLILGITPGLWFVPEGRPVEVSRTALGRYRNWSPSQRAGLWLAVPLQRTFAFINQEDLTLPVLIDRIDLANRPGTAAHLPPQLPPYFGGTDIYRQARMWDACDFGTPLAQKIQQIWLPLFTPPPPPPHLSEDEFRQMMAGHVEAQLARFGHAVETIRKRGGRIVLVRLPSSGTLRELENQFTPRAVFFDGMVRAAGAPAIHFEDYPQLASFECPEWSHLRAEDATRFTEALLPLLEDAFSRQ